MNSKIISLISSIALTTNILISTAFAETDNNFLLGDVNNDSEITSADALLVLQNVTGIIDFTDIQIKFADMDKDNVVTSADALKILQYVVGITTTTAATTKAPVVTTTPKVTTTKPTTTTPKVTTTVTTTTTKATEPPQTEPPVVETDWWQYYSDYANGNCKFGCRNSSEWGYVLKTLDDNFWSAYSDTWDWVDERGINSMAEDYFEGDTQFAHTWLTIHGMGGHIVNAAGGVGIEGDLGQSGWGSPYQVLCQNGDCDSHSQFERALWWYLDDGYDTCLVTSDSLNHAWVCVRLPDGRQYDLDGQGIRQGDNIPADAYYHWGEY